MLEPPTSVPPPSSLLFWGGSISNQVTSASFALGYTSNRAPFFRLYAAGQTYTADITSPAIPLKKWCHVAGVYDSVKKNMFLYIDGELMNVVAGPSTLQPNAAYFIGGISGGSSQSVSGAITEVRLWNRRLDEREIRANMNRSLVGSEPGLAGYWPMQDRFGSTATDRAGVSDATLVNCSFAQVERGMFSQQIFVQGHCERSAHVTKPIAPCGGPVRIGSDCYQNYLQATVDEVSVWKVGRTRWEIDADYRGRPLDSDRSELVSAWNFEAGSGRVAVDSKGTNNAAILDASGRLSDKAVDAMWVPTHFNSAWTLFINGVEGHGDPYTFTAVTTAQLSLGGIAAQSPAGFSGALGEVRLWNTPQSQAALLGRMNHPLSGFEQDLVGYWPLNSGSGTTMADNTPRGNNGNWQGGPSGPDWNTESAPVRDEAPPVYTQTVSGSPAVVEYGELERGTSGLPTAAVNWCYAYVDSAGALNMLTDFCIGQLDVQYVGQVQTNPTIVGYIEGAPPLPSENLTVDSPMTPYKYLAASSIMLTAAENTEMIYSASRDRGFDQAYEIRYGGAIGANIGWQSVKFAAGLRATFEHKLGWLSEAKLTTSASGRVDKTIDVFGSWEANPYTFLANVPRYYLPNNKGYALVKSGTSDLYALRMKGSGALVAYSMRPSPDVPEDINVIMFPIDPTYVKNGTLDGWIGFQQDQDYKSLQAGEYGSFFKPLEAYALKQQIEREAQLLQTYYEQFNAGAVGRRPDAGPTAVGKSGRDLAQALMRYNPAEGSAEAVLADNVTALARRNLVNTYVWNSDGGLYTEEEQVAIVAEESSGGSYEFVGRGGIYASLSMMTGPEVSLDALWGGHIRTLAVKTKDEGTSFGIATKVPGEGFLNVRLPDSDENTTPLGAYPVPYSSASCAGKVNQYRFMTFYLAPSKANFDELASIVDQDWLQRRGDYASVADPDAFALREALNNPNEVWRVLHRVTYVNRIAAVGQTGDGESLAPLVQEPDGNSLTANAVLMALLPVTATDPTPLQTIGNELGALLTQWQQNPLWGSVVTAQQVQIRSDIMAYMQFRQGAAPVTLGSAPADAV